MSLALDVVRLGILISQAFWYSNTPSRWLFEIGILAGWPRVGWNIRVVVGTRLAFRGLETQYGAFRTSQLRLLVFEFGLSTTS